MDYWKKNTEEMAAEAKAIGHESETGKVSTDVALAFYEKAISPAILYNLEVWRN